MEFWFSEMHTPHVKLSIRVDRQLYSGKSEFQRIDVFDSPEFGRFLTLDGYMMLTEKDEFIYHEMITHVPMAVHPHVEKVLVIGAGDGGVIRELVQYQDLQHIDMVEIDPLVVEVCKKYLPKTACRLEDPRLTIHYEDGLKFIRSRQEEYDLIIVDSTDPFGPGEGLFTREFYGNCYKALKEDGILINQHESPFYPGTQHAAASTSHGRICLRPGFIVRVISPAAWGWLGTSLWPRADAVRTVRRSTRATRRPTRPAGWTTGYGARRPTRRSPRSPSRGKPTSNVRPGSIRP